jgi:hypothetical protein
MTDQLVLIESGLGNGLYLGIQKLNNGTARCVTATISDPNGISWEIHPLIGTSMFYLQHAGTGLVCVTNQQGADIMLATQQNGYAAGDNLGQLITTDDTGLGLVAINNYNKSLVFDVKGANIAVGTEVINWPWNSGNNQRWRLNPID